MASLRILASIILSITLASFACADQVDGADRYKRPMIIHKIKRMGLEVWTEMEPEWKTELMMSAKKPVFVAHTPANVYPPVGMMWVNHAEVQLDGVKEFQKVAKSTLKTVARNYGISNTDLKALKIIPSTYGVLNGFEVSFKGRVNHKSVDVKAFTGRTGNKGPITMQVYTSLGKLHAIKEQIRRSWTHTRYLEG